jgi:hypothetical protein
LANPAKMPRSSLAHHDKAMRLFKGLTLAIALIRRNNQLWRRASRPRRMRRFMVNIKLARIFKRILEPWNPA